MNRIIGNFQTQKANSFGIFILSIVVLIAALLKEDNITAGLEIFFFFIFMLSFYNFHSFTQSKINKTRMAYLNTGTILVFLICLKISQAQGQYLGANLLQNGDFQLPQISPPLLSWTQQFSNSIVGWRCSNKCKLGKLSSSCLLGLGALCSLASGGQILSLQSSSGNQDVYQTFQITDLGLYQLTFSWLPPQSATLNGKFFNILITGSYIDSIFINSSNYQLTQFSVYTTRVNLTTYHNDFKFVTQGPVDGYGIMVDNVILQQVLTNYTNNSTNSTNANTSQTSNSSQLTNNSSNNQSSSNNSSNQTSSNNSTNNQSSVNNSGNQTSSNQTDNNITNPSNQIQNTTEYQSYLLVYSDFLFQNKLMTMSNAIPGGRVYLKLILDFFPNFDRLQFYIFHKQNFTYYAQYFLQAIQRLKQSEGQILSSFIDSNAYLKRTKTGEQFLLSLNYKEKYQNQFYLTRNSDGHSFLTNQAAFFYYHLPVLLLIYAICYILFLVTFSWKISQNFRKYCFFGLILVILFQGNMEQFTFFQILQLKLCFSGNFTHKIVNCFIIFFGFLTLLFSIGVILIFKWYYQLASKYFIEELRFTISSFLFVSLQNGIIPLASGVIHAFYFEELLNVTVSLVLMEILWIIARIYLYSFSIFEQKYKVIVNIINSFLRIIFLITLYLHDNGYQTSLMNKIHLYFMLSYLFMWVIQTTLTFYFLSKELIIYFYRSIKRICPSNKVESTNSKKIEHNTDIVSQNYSWRQRLAHINSSKKHVFNATRALQLRKSNFSAQKSKRKILNKDRKVKIQDYY